MSSWWLVSYVALWVLVVVLCVVVVALARQIGTLHLRLGPRGALEMDDEGPPLGEQVEPLEVTDVDGHELVLGGERRAQLLLFVSRAAISAGRCCPRSTPSPAAVSFPQW